MERRVHVKKGSRMRFHRIVTIQTLNDEDRQQRMCAALQHYRRCASIWTGKKQELTKPFWCWCSSARLLKGTQRCVSSWGPQQSALAASGAEAATEFLYHDRRLLESDVAPHGEWRMSASQS